MLFSVACKGDKVLCIYFLILCAQPSFLVSVFFLSCHAFICSSLTILLVFIFISWFLLHFHSSVYRGCQFCWLKNLTSLGKVLCIYCLMLCAQPSFLVFVFFVSCRAFVCCNLSTLHGSCFNAYLC